MKQLTTSRENTVCLFLPTQFSEFGYHMFLFFKNLFFLKAFKKAESGPGSDYF